MTNKSTRVHGWKDELSTPSVGQNFSDVPEDKAVASVPSKRSAQDVISEVQEIDVNALSRKPPHKRVTVLEVDFLSESGSDYIDSKPSSARSPIVAVMATVSSGCCDGSHWEEVRIVHCPAISQTDVAHILQIQQSRRYKRCAVLHQDN